MGLLQFFRRFIPNFASISAAPKDATKKESSVQNWNERWDISFCKLKDTITSAPILVALNLSKPFCEHIDASETALGGTFTKLDDNGEDKVTSFFSKKLSLVECI